MSEYEQIIDEIVKHGVAITVNKIVDDNDIPHERKYVGSVVKLDFSKHDKAFENEIAGLKAKIAIKDMDYKTASELLGKYQQENESLKKRVVELENFSCQAEQETESLVEKLKQRIAELESKETEKLTEVNLNDMVKVKLTPLGAEIYYHQYDELNKKIKANGGNPLEPRMPQIDKDGYTKMQLHEFISLYGEHVGMCKPNVIEPINIVLV